MLKVRSGVLTVACAVIAVAVLSSEAPAASMVKVGVISLQKALNATTDGMAAKETLKQKHMGKQETINAMQAEMQSLEEKLASPVISEATQADLKEKILSKRAELIEFVQKAKEEEEKDNQALSGRILEGLVEIVRDIAREEGYTVILERTSGGVIYVEDPLDLTDRVVRIYNEKNQPQ